jgi:hypothetical protein
VFAHFVYEEPRRRLPIRSAFSVLLAATLIVAYTGGVSHAHWQAQVDSTAHAGTGGLGLDLEDPLDRWDYLCETRYGADPISFLRLWWPDREPGPETPGSDGAVKIEEDGMVGGDSVLVEPNPVRLGDLVTITYPGGETLEILNWVEHGTEPGRYVGFRYRITPSDVEIMADVKHGPDIERTPLSGEGLWPPDGAFTGPDDLDPDDRTETIVGCEEPRLSSAFTVGNQGSIPVVPHLHVTSSPGGIADACEYFDAAISRAGEVLYAGPLCDLIDQRVRLLSQLDPGDTASCELTFSIALPLPPAEMTYEVVQNLQLDFTLVQWNRGPGSGGWVIGTQLPVQLNLTVLPPPQPEVVTQADTTTPADGDTPPDTDQPSPDDGAPPPTAAPPPPDADQPPPDAGAPPPTAAPPPPDADQPPPDDNAPPPDDKAPPPPDEKPPPPADSPPPDGEPQPPGTAPEPSDPETLAGISGSVWHDLNLDGVNVLLDPLTELPIRKATVAVYDQSGAKVAQQKTDAEGAYAFGDLEPGTYHLEFTAPEGFTFRDPAIAITVDITALAAQLGIEEAAIVVDDLAEVWSEDRGGRVWIHARTAPVALRSGGDTVAFDAAMTLPPDSETTTGGRGTEEPAPVLPGQPNPNASAPTPPEPPEPAVGEESQP